jgi:mono/diheme cytochrome c family protein
MKNQATRYPLIALSVAAAASCAVLGVAGARSPEATDRAAVLARGEYLVTVGGCNDCHTPWQMGPTGPAPDMTRALSGHPQDFPVQPVAASAGSPWAVSVAATNTAFSGPWGVSFAANLTPCAETGIGAWTEEIFINTLRTGRHWGQSRPILPPMPWFNYGKMSDDDLKAVFTYLRSLPPHRNSVPEPLPPAGTEIAENGWN